MRRVLFVYFGCELFGYIGFISVGIDLVFFRFLGGGRVVGLVGLGSM